MSFETGRHLVSSPIPEEYHDNRGFERPETELLLLQRDLDNQASGTYESINYEADSENLLPSFACTSKTKSHARRNTTTFVKRLRSGSFDVSLLEKLSDDRHASAFLSAWNVSSLIQGNGIFGIPYAVAQGGWAAIACIFLAAFICCYTGKILINCLYEESKETKINRRLRTNFPEIGEAVYKKHGHNLIACTQFFELSFAVTMNIVLLGAVLADLLKTCTNFGLPEWAAISCIVVLPALFISRMYILSWLSMISVLASMGSILTLIVFGFTKMHDWKLTNIPTFNPTTFPISLGIIVFTYSGHEIFPSIEASMRKPEQFNSVLNSTFMFSTIIKTLLGAVMVLAFGEKTDEVATLNLHENEVFRKAAAALVISNVVFTIPLVMFVLSLTFDSAILKYFPHLNRDSKYHWVWLLITRPALLCAGLCLALVIPHFGLLVSFVGSFTGACHCFIFPSWFHLKLRWNKLSSCQVALNVFVMVFGIAVGSSGLFFSGKAIVESFIDTAKSFKT